jgi:hypothetical protein
MMIRNTKALVKYFFIYCILFIVPGCDGVSFPSPAPPTTGLEIFVFEYKNHQKLGGKFESFAENDLSSLNQDDLRLADIIVSENDIVSYDWASQKIILKNRDSQPSNSIGSFIQDYSVFIVSFQDEPLFSGLVLYTISPYLPDTPVLYVTPKSMTPEVDGLVVYLRPPYNPVFSDGNAGSPFPGEDTELAERLREHLESVGKLSE